MSGSDGAIGLVHSRLGGLGKYIRIFIEALTALTPYFKA